MVSGRNLNLSKFSCMSSLPARMKMIQSKMKSMGIFPDAQWQLIPQSLIRSGRLSVLVRDVINVLATCKNKEDPIKNESARVVKRL